MKRRLDRTVREWLLAEQSGHAEEAEYALARALGILGRWSPPAGFADRVLACAGIARARSYVWRSRWLRAVVVGSLLVGGMAFTLLPAMFALLLRVANLFGFSVLSDAWHWAVRWVQLSLTSWALVEDVAAALRSSLGHQTTMMLVAANALVAIVSLLGLRRLLMVPEEMIRC